MNINYLELVGYLASAFVLASMLMSSVVKLRIINLTGALLFSIYGFLIGSLPVGIMNACIVMANGYHLIKMTQSKENFSLIQLREDSLYLKKFVTFHKKDIEKFFKTFDFDQSRYLYSFLFLRNTTVAGILLCKKFDKNTLIIDIDYVTPKYRDLKIGKYIYKNQTHFFKEKGFNRLLIFPKTHEHEKYAKFMGFEQEKDFFALNI